MCALDTAPNDGLTIDLYQTASDGNPNALAKIVGAEFSEPMHCLIGQGALSLP